MTTIEMFKQINEHPVSGEIGLEMRWGFPFYELRSNTLFVRLWPHRERYAMDGISFFKPAYEVMLAFPFRHLCRFDNLVLQGRADAGRMAHRAEGNAFAQRYQEATAELYALSDQLLEALESGEPQQKEILSVYRLTLLRHITDLELTDVYAEEVN